MKLRLRRYYFKKGVMRNRTISLSSDSGDEDDIPLKQIKQNKSKADPNAYDNLRKHSIQACEFCDRISNNRYSSLIHNASHIIIPLLNQKVVQCCICLHSFTSQAELRSHSIRRHPELPVEKIPVRTESGSGKKKVSQSTTILLEDEPNVITLGTKENGSATEPIKNRLKFEDDDLIFVSSTSNQLLNDLTTDCKVNLEVFDTPWLNGDGEGDEFSGKSVHYDELIKPGVYRCKKCGKGFPFRYDAIIHETSHIKLKNSQLSLCVICKKYLVGGRKDLRHHYLTYHKETIDKKHNTPDSEFLPKIFEDSTEDKRTFDSKILSLCDLCFSFCRNKSSMNYECTQTVSKIGKRYECEKCGQLFFEINLVKRSLQRRALYGTHTQKKRKKTNEDRLKTIANRFKMMKH
ncbi:hypothetical protein PYW07_013366 [Mythimna separata]|uniref:C2H2-type domain-containing protein n=1 Tax=Mythimna separata TaxID=271217 RepID=A0AAD7Y646_MYTSE|nr:hypothetical protein PYW07_013366 [Mythimna separata]